LMQADQVLQIFVTRFFRKHKAQQLGKIALGCPDSRELPVESTDLQALL
jgi:hypothetical protein